MMNAGAVDVPVMERRAAGEVVPSPRLPDWARRRSVDVALVVVVDAMANNGEVEGKVLGAATDSIAQGEEEPMPSALFAVSRVRKFAESRVVEFE